VAGATASGIAWLASGRILSKTRVTLVLGLNPRRL